jgi:hypothetical protein
VRQGGRGGEEKGRKIGGPLGTPVLSQEFDPHSSESAKHAVDVNTGTPAERSGPHLIWNKGVSGCHQLRRKGWGHQLLHTPVGRHRQCNSTSAPDPLGPAAVEPSQNSTPLTWTQLLIIKLD